MKKIVLYDPAISSMNLGDKIISESAKNNLSFLLDESFDVEISTHLPLSYSYMRHLKDINYKFVLGSNLLKSTFFGFKRQWDITLRLSQIAGPCILMGVGWWQYGNEPNLYTKILLNSILSKKYLHSVRDQYTEKLLKNIGINNVINTACPTMWSLTPNHCNEIKKKKSENVIFTLTDYKKNKEKDIELINILLKNYNDIYFWPQGISDFDYFKSLKINENKIIVLDPSLNALNKILEKNIDYIGTRLHGGIRALQKKVRTIIISIDNRAREKSKSYNLPIVERDNLSSLEEKIISEFSTDINLPLENIKKWKSQFN